MTTVDHWVNQAPAHWTRGRLKNLISAASNGTWGSDPKEDATNVRCIRAADFNRIQRRANVERAPFRSIDKQALRQHQLHPGDLILEKSGGGERQPVGMAVLFEGADRAVCSNFCAKVTPASGVDSRFLNYVFSAAYSQGLTEIAIKQTTGIQNLDMGAFLSASWAYPEMGEQHRIADFLDTETARIDRLASLQTEVIVRLDERESAIVDLAIDNLIERAGTAPFRRFITGMDQGSSPQCDAVPADDDEWGVLKVSCLRPGSFRPDQNKRLPEGSLPDSRNEVRAGDLLITRANTPQLVGSTAVVPAVRRGLLLSDKIFRVTIANSLDSHYVALIARGSRVRAMCSASSNGASQSMANIRFDEVKEWPIPVISKSEQKKVVSEIDRSRTQTAALRTRIVRQLDLLAERRQALITAAVTGQFDVSTASGRGVESP
ncbi:restriction endonuclease subunit S [Streptomyces canus]|uniref:restriction endonuclease subunit S n=1 Tax=Streptomyces canus TaxID=58343 RepID=UPI00277DB552|nr:restriction endonuclease subunit S [Streptomyces canus]MDQ0765255.1 type I restriction enzyme S subunit [Streptomyces canus]